MILLTAVGCQGSRPVSSETDDALLSSAVDLYLYENEDWKIDIVVTLQTLDVAQIANLLVILDVIQPEVALTAPMAKDVGEWFETTVLRGLEGYYANNNDGGTDEGILFTWSAAQNTGGHRQYQIEISQTGFRRLARVLNGDRIQVTRLQDGGVLLNADVALTDLRGVSYSVLPVDIQVHGREILDVYNGIPTQSRMIGRWKNPNSPIEVSMLPIGVAPISSWAIGGIAGIGLLALATITILGLRSRKRLRASVQPTPPRPPGSQPGKTTKPLKRRKGP